MNQDTLNAFLVIFLAIITGCVVAITYFFVQALRSVERTADDLSETAQSFKDKLQFKVLAAIPALLLTLVRNIRKRG